MQGIKKRKRRAPKTLHHSNRLYLTEIMIQAYRKHTGTYVITNREYDSIDAMAEAAAPYVVQPEHETHLSRTAWGDLKLGLSILGWLLFAVHVIQLIATNWV